MNVRTSVRSVKLAAALLVAIGASAMAAGAASASEAIYNNIPSPLPGNFASFGNEAYSMSEFGGLVELAGSARKNPKVTVVMSAWGCQTGGVFQDTCETPKPGKKFKWPITLNIYDVGPGNTVGAKIGSVTKTFKLPYRPSENDVECVSKSYEKGTWFDAATNRCYHGMAFAITFKTVHVELRQKAIVTVSYNTSNHGPSPVGAAACNSTSAGCYYDSLNVAITEPSEATLSLGSQPTKSLYLNTTYGEMYCGSSTPLGTFGPTAPIEGACAASSPYETEENIQPAISVSAR